MPLDDNDVLEKLRNVGLNITQHDLQNPTYTIMCQIYGHYLNLMKNQSFEEFRLDHMSKLNEIFSCSLQETHSGSMPLLTFYVQLKSIFTGSFGESFFLSDLIQPQKKKFLSQLKMFLTFYDFTDTLKGILMELHQQDAGHQVDLQLKQETFNAMNERVQELRSNMHIMMPTIKSTKDSIDQQIRIFTQHVMSLESKYGTYKDVKFRLQQLQQQNDQALKKLQAADEQLSSIQKRQYDQATLHHLQAELGRMDADIQTQENQTTEQRNEMSNLDRQIAQLQRLNTELTNYQEQSFQTQQLQQEVEFNTQIIIDGKLEIQQLDDTIKTLKDDIQRLNEQYRTSLEDLQKLNNPQQGPLRQDYVQRIQQKNNLVQINLQKKSRLEKVLDNLNDKVTYLKDRQQQHARDATRLVDSTNELLKIWCTQAEVISRGI